MIVLDAEDLDGIEQGKRGDAMALWLVSFIDNRPLLTAEVIGYVTADNAFICIGDFVRAKILADEFRSSNFHRILDRYDKHAAL